MVIGLLELPYHATSLKAQLPTRPPFTLGDFLRVAVRDRPAKSLKGLSRMTNLCGVSHVQMAKVQPRETVWKIARGLLDCGHGWSIVSKNGTSWPLFSALQSSRWRPIRISRQSLHARL